jgi:hypothetical protein
MQIPEDSDELPTLRLKRRRETTSIERLLRERQTEDDTVRMPLSAIAFWRDAVEPEQDMVAVRMRQPRDADEEGEVTLTAPFGIV